MQTTTAFELPGFKVVKTLAGLSQLGWVGERNPNKFNGRS